MHPIPKPLCQGMEQPELGVVEATWRSQRRPLNSRTAHQRKYTSGMSCLSKAVAHFHQSLVHFIWEIPKEEKKWSFTIRLKMHLRKDRKSALFTKRWLYFQWQRCFVINNFHKFQGGLEVYRGLQFGKRCFLYWRTVGVSLLWISNIMLCVNRQNPKSLHLEPLKSDWNMRPFNWVSSAEQSIRCIPRRKPTQARSTFKTELSTGFLRRESLGTTFPVTQNGNSDLV